MRGCFGERVDERVGERVGYRVGYRVGKKGLVVRIRKRCI